MSTREDLDKFMTPASQALVDQFMADTVDEPDDFDMDEVVRQNLADHEAALTGEQPKPDVVDLLKREAEHVRYEMAATDLQAGLVDLKRRLKNPKPTVGYITVHPGWDPRDRQDNIYLWIQHPTTRDAQASVEFAKMVGSDRTVIVKVTTTFEIVEDDSDD